MCCMWGDLLICCRISVVHLDRKVGSGNAQTSHQYRCWICATPAKRWHRDNNTVILDVASDPTPQPLSLSQSAAAIARLHSEYLRTIPSIANANIRAPLHQPSALIVEMDDDDSSHTVADDQK